MPWILVQFLVSTCLFDIRTCWNWNQRKEKEQQNKLSRHIHWIYFMSTSVSSSLSRRRSRPLSLCFTDGRDEGDGAGRVLRHWALSPNGWAWADPLHAPPLGRQPSEHLHPTITTTNIILIIHQCLSAVRTVEVNRKSPSLHPKHRREPANCSFLKKYQTNIHRYVFLKTYLLICFGLFLFYFTL